MHGVALCDDLKTHTELCTEWQFGDKTTNDKQPQLNHNAATTPPSATTAQNQVIRVEEHPEIREEKRKMRRK